MLKENIIDIKFDQQYEVRKPTVCIIGAGKLLDLSISVLKEELNIIKNLTLEEYLKSPEDNVDTILVIPDESDYKDIIRLNSILVKKEIPFFMMYFDGKRLRLGPYVFPWKTPCMECHLTHHLRILNLTLDKKINMKNLHNLKFSYELPSEFHQYQIKFLAKQVTSEIMKIFDSKKDFNFIKTEKPMLPGKYDADLIKNYQPILDCLCCHGMNKSFKVINSVRDLEYEKEKKELIIGINPIRYNNGGYRCKTTEETENFINKTINDIGIEILIEAINDNPFFDIVPVYDAVLNNKNNHKLPYFLDSQLSHGKGLTTIQAKFSATFELFERLSARYFGEKKIIRASTSEIGNYAIDLDSFVNQIYNSNTSYEKYTKDTVIDWVWGKSLITGEAKLIPASMVFLSPAVFRGILFNNTSSGLSAGVTVEDAILQGLFELVEHDAWLIGQSNFV